MPPFLHPFHCWASLRTSLILIFLVQKERIGRPGAQGTVLLAITRFTVGLSLPDLNSVSFSPFVSFWHSGPNPRLEQYKVVRMVLSNPE